MTTSSDAARESARKGDGKFGHQLHGLPERGLNGLPDGVTMIGPDDAAWPAALNDMDNPPKRLYLRGAGDLTELLTKPTVAITGSRNCTIYGAEKAAEFSKELAENDRTIVTSGGYGCGGSATRGALRADKPSIIVSASGIDNDHPAGHWALFAEVAKTGVIVS